MPASEPPLLVATDLDGTLLREDKSVSSRTRSVLEALQAVGIPVVPVTARQPYGLYPIVDPIGITGPAICANGAVAVEIATRDVLFTRTISTAEARRLVQAVRTADERVRFAAVGPKGEWFRAEEEYAAASQFSDHQRARSQMTICGLDEIACECSKIVLRVPGEQPEATLSRLGEHMAPCHATTSGAPFVEVMAPGVTKAAGLAMLCAQLGIPQERVWAFGDALNDVDMLQWAGRSFAVANACEQVRQQADVLVDSNENDGVAVSLATLLDAGELH